MNRRRRLILEMIRRLEQGTSIPATILIQPYPLVNELPKVHPKAPSRKQALPLA